MLCDQGLPDSLARLSNFPVHFVQRFSFRTILNTLCQWHGPVHGKAFPRILCCWPNLIAIFRLLSRPGSGVRYFGRNNVVSLSTPESASPVALLLPCMPGLEASNRLTITCTCQDHSFFAGVKTSVVGVKVYLHSDTFLASSQECEAYAVVALMRHVSYEVWHTAAFASANEAYISGLDSNSCRGADMLIKADTLHACKCPNPAASAAPYIGCSPG